MFFIVPGFTSADKWWSKILREFIFNKLNLFCYIFIWFLQSFVFLCNNLFRRLICCCSFFGNFFFVVEAQTGHQLPCSGCLTHPVYFIVRYAVCVSKLRTKCKVNFLFLRDFFFWLFLLLTAERLTAITERLTQDLWHLSLWFNRFGWPLVNRFNL